MLVESTERLWHNDIHSHIHTYIATEAPVEVPPVLKKKGHVSYFLLKIWQRVENILVLHLSGL